MRNKISIPILFFLFLTFFKAQAQITVTATGYAGYYYAAASSTSIYPGGGVTFNVTNTNAYPIALTDVGYSAYLNYNAELWYSSTSTSGSAGIVNSSNPAWTLLSSVTSPVATFATIVNNFFTGFTVVIPPATTYRFAVKQDGALFGGPTLIPGTFSSNGVTLDAGSTLWGADQFGGLNMGGYGYYGSITFTDCLPPVGLNVTNILSKTATVGWTASAGSIGYDYIVDQNPTYTSGTYKTITGITDNVTGLVPATIHYLHVRNKCSSSSSSGWANYKFTTLPPCSIPSNFKPFNLLPVSTNIKWDPVPVALSYDYVVDQTTDDPISATNIKNVSTPTDFVSGLIEDTKYYVHIRSNCTGEQSNWSLDSFTTPIPCRPPVISIDYVNIDEAVAYWQSIPTAISYEYAVSTSSTPPAQGTKYIFTSIHVSALADGKDYYMHVRSSCISQGSASFSPWATKSFHTFALGVNQVSADGFRIDAYPNPVKNILNVKLNGLPSGKAEIAITDMSGKIIHTVPATVGVQELNMNDMAAGIYMLRYKDDSHNQVIKIIKQ